MNSMALLFTLRPPHSPNSPIISLPPLFSLSYHRKWAPRIHSGPQIKSYYIVIFHLHSLSLHIRLFPSITLTSLLFSFPRSELPLALSLPKEKGICWAERCNKVMWDFPIYTVMCNRIRWARVIRTKNHVAWNAFLVRVHFSSQRFFL